MYKDNAYNGTRARRFFPETTCTVTHCRVGKATIKRPALRPRPHWRAFLEATPTLMLS